MSKPNTTCRVCGKEYFCCSDSRGINSWKAMACSQKCYKEYMRRIEISRKPKIDKVEVEEKVEEIKAEKTNEEQPIVKMRHGKKKTANETVKPEEIIVKD